MCGGGSRLSMKRKIIEIIYAIFRLLPIKKDTVLIFSYYGEQYSGSPKYIGKYLQENSNFKIIWAFVNKDAHKDAIGKKIRYGHLSYYMYLATAGTIITNYRMTDEFKKRSGQKYIQTWHSSLRLKMIEKDAEASLPPDYVKMAKNDSKQIDYLLAGSQKSREIFEEAFWYNGEIVNCGTPQCDILFGDRQSVAKKVFEYYNIPQDGHIVMYAPTFRKNHDLSVYDLNADVLLANLKKRFGGEWYLLMRLHPHLVNLADSFKYTDKIIKATDYDDVQELLCATDVLITDYSAIMFDFAHTKRPCFLYTPDLENYINNDRKLYFDIKKLPFGNFKKQDEMFKCISDFSEVECVQRVDNFMDEIGSFDDGNACRRIYQLLKEIWQ